MFEWNYISTTEKSNGYENELELQKYTHEYYNSLNEEEKIMLLKIYLRYIEIKTYSQ